MVNEELRVQFKLKKNLMGCNSADLEHTKTSRILIFVLASWALRIITLLPGEAIFSVALCLFLKLPEKFWQKLQSGIG